MKANGSALAVLAVAVLGGLIAVAQAANTSRPTGKGALRDESVYCQEWPGGPSRPAYPGTGPQTPCGPNFQRSPTSDPPPPGAEEVEISRPPREAALVQPQALRTAASTVTPAPRSEQTSAAVQLSIGVVSKRLEGVMPGASGRDPMEGPDARKLRRCSPEFGF